MKSAAMRGRPRSGLVTVEHRPSDPGRFFKPVQSSKLQIGGTGAASPAVRVEGLFIREFLGNEGQGRIVSPQHIEQLWLRKVRILGYVKAHAPLKGTLERLIRHGAILTPFPSPQLFMSKLQL